jgi:hypothetical protein
VARSRASRRKRSRPNNHLIDSKIKVNIGTEPKKVVLTLRCRINPASLIPTEGPLTVVAGNDVLAKLRPYKFKQKAKVPEYWPGTQNRVALLKEVPNKEADKKNADSHKDPLDKTHAF